MTILDLTMRKLAEAAKNPTFRRVDDTIDFLQDLLYKRKSNLAVPINSKVEGVIKSTIGKLNEQLKTIGGTEYRAYNSVISETKAVFDDLNKALGKDANKGGSLMKRVFSPTDGGTKKLFEKVKGLTGIDLVDEATLAKLAMEIAGDTRQANLLEQLGLIIKPSTSSAVMEAGKWVLKKLQDTEGKARSIIDDAIGKKKDLNLKTPAAYDDTLGKIKPGLTIQDVSQRIKEMTPDEVKIMEDFIDKTRSGKKLSVEEETIARQLAEEFEINPDMTNSKLADFFEPILDTWAKIGE
jgi:hypothetical protein